MKKPIDLNNRTQLQSTPDLVQIQEIIKVTLVRGDGTENDPIRQVYQYWEKDGIFITEIDTLAMLD